MSVAESLPILFQDDWLVAIDKPAGVHVHPPEDRSFRIRPHENGLARLRDQIGRYLYPVHRLDPATTGILVYALTQEAARSLAASFASREVSKRYWAVVRGHAPDRGVVDSPLKRDSTGTLAQARTDYACLRRTELPYPVRPHPSARYSWLEAEPRTGMWHQIRRHLARISHPIVGDSQHGDLEHNRLFRERLGLPGLLLRAVSIRFAHPGTGEPLELAAGTSPVWEQARAALPWVEA